jgi:hypothetical protein
MLPFAVPAAMVIMATAVLAVASRTEAEVVALKTGERVECVVKRVSNAEVVVDVGGDSLTFQRDEVAVIYLGATAQAAARSPLHDALRVLEGLQSQVSAGVSYRDYAQRVTEAKAAVEQLLAEEPPGAARTALAEALGFYVYAADAWSARIANTNFDGIGANPLIEACEPLEQEVVGGHKRASARGIQVAFLGIEPLFGCASGRVLAAKGLLREP